MLPGELVQLYRKKYPKSRVVLYINTLAEAKANCDAVCTSANSAEIVARMDSKAVLFGPDWNLAQYVKGYTKKQLPMWHKYRVELYPHFGQISGIKDEFNNDLQFPAAFRKTRDTFQPKGIIKIIK